MQSHLSKLEDLMLQNTTPLRTSAPWPPNTSDSCASCTAPAARHASLQALFKRPTPAIVFETAAKPTRLTRYWQGADFIAQATENDARTSKSGLNIWCFPMLTSKCASRHNSVHLCSPNMVLLTFWLQTVLRAATACTFWASQLNFQKCSEPALFFSFSLSNLLRATLVHNFSSHICPDGSTPAALANLLLDPPEPQNIGRTQCLTTFRPFRAHWSSFFRLFLFFASAHLCCFICPYCRKFDF